MGSNDKLFSPHGRAVLIPPYSAYWRFLADTQAVLTLRSACQKVAGSGAGRQGVRGGKVVGLEVGVAGAAEGIFASLCVG